MSYQRLYPQRINWEDEPSLATPINQVNLNKMDSALYGIDGRVVELDEGKVGKTETFNTSRNGVVPKPAPADITHEKVLRADGVWVEQSGGGGGGGGHTIVDNAGTSLQQRGKLKTVGGLNAQDDSTNNTTKITDEYEIIPWTTWQSYSDAEKAQHPNAIVTDAPDCDGDVEIENMHLLWTNPSPTSGFTAQNVILSSGDYDLRVVEWYDYVGNNVFYTSFPKGKNSKLVFAYDSTSSPYNATCSRTITHVSDTVLTFGSTELYYPSGHNTNDGFCVPIAIYGQNKQITAKIKAIAHDVSTSASKCMMSDGVTSVEDAITKNKLESYVTITSYTSQNRYTFPSDGYVTLNNRGSTNNALALIVGANDNSNYTVGIGGAQGQFGLYVKKGMKTYIYEGTTTGYYFLPLS